MKNKDLKPQKTYITTRNHKKWFKPVKVLYNKKINLLKTDKDYGEREKQQ